MAGNKWLGIAWRDKELLGLLEKLSRLRPLASDEAALMQALLYRCNGRQNERWWWTKEEDAELARLNARWARYGRPPPYQQDDQIRSVAEKFGRSYMAVHRRLERLRKKRGWKRPQMFKRANGNGTLKCTNGQARRTQTDSGDEGRPAGYGGRTPEAITGRTT